MTTWFPGKHPEQLRVAQSVATVQQQWGTLVSIVCTMLAALPLQAFSGFGWTAAAWQVGMGTLAYVAAESWNRLSRLPRPFRVSPHRIRRIHTFTALYGLGWAVGLINWSAVLGAEMQALVIALSLTQTSYAVAAFYFVPAGVALFTLLVSGAACLALVDTWAGSTARFSVLLVGVHALGTLFFLRRNWDHFVHRVDLDVQRTRLAELLQEQKDVAERAVQMKTRFLAAASHDLRQPMHAISL